MSRHLSSTPSPTSGEGGARRRREGEGSRVRDVIDINRTWSVYVGSLASGAYTIGHVQAADSFLARQAARLKWPDTRIGGVTEERCR